jgi:hypothetical protein
MALRAVSATTDGTAVPGGARPGPGRFAELALEPYLYLSPALVLLALVMFVPLIVGLSYLTSWSAAATLESTRLQSLLM